jgi:uncharacterized membrane protein YhaH (DUF805 family)/DNA-binding CsgD family transcriptional regulator
MSEENYNPISFKGRLRRVAFVVSLVVVNVGMYIVFSYSQNNMQQHWEAKQYGYNHQAGDEKWLILLLFALCVWVCICAFVKRTRDAGLNPWLSVLGWIPFLSIPYTIFLLFKPSVVGGESFQNDNINKNADSTYRKVEKESAIAEQGASEVEEDAYLKAQEELFSDEYDQALWAKAYAVCEADEAKAQAYYIREKVKRIGGSNALNSFDVLSSHEKEVLFLFSQKTVTVKMIASHLEISLQSVESSLSRIISKLKMKNINEVVDLATQSGWLRRYTQANPKREMACNFDDPETKKLFEQFKKEYCEDNPEQYFADNNLKARFKGWLLENGYKS